MNDEIVLDTSAEDHDQNTIFQQNNSQMNEVLQSIIEVRRQTSAEFEQRMRQQDQMFQQTMQMLVHNQTAKDLQATQLQQQAQGQQHSEAMREAANTVAMHYADIGVITILP